MPGLRWRACPKKRPRSTPRRRKKGLFLFSAKLGEEKQLLVPFEGTGNRLLVRKPIVEHPKALPCTTSCHRASKTEPPGARCLMCPALGAAGGRGSRHPLKLAVASSFLPELGPKKKILRLRKEPGEGWCQGGSRGAASAPGVSPGTAASRKCSSNTSPSQILGKGLGLPSLAPTASTEEAALKGEAQKAGKAPLR